MNDDERRERAAELFSEAHDLQMSGRLSEAERMYLESIAILPTAEAYTFLGWTFSMQGRLDEAIEECRRAIEVDPTFGNPYNDIGAYLIQMGRLDDALPWLQQALRAPRYESYCYPHMNMARVFEMKRQWTLSREAYQKALRERPDYRPAQQGLARVSAVMN